MRNDTRDVWRPILGVSGKDRLGNWESVILRESRVDDFGLDVWRDVDEFWVLGRNRRSVILEGLRVTSDLYTSCLMRIGRTV